MLNPVIVTAMGGIAATYVFFWALLHLTQDCKEPPVVSCSIPFLSPIMGMIRWSMDFYPRMRERHRKLPICILRIPGTRIYVINSLDLIPMVQRQWSTLIFAPIQVKAAQAAMGASKDAIAILKHDLVTEHGFVNGMVKATHPTMSNGPTLDALNTEAFEVFDEALNQFAIPTIVNMFEWISKEIMHATTDAVFGPFNPMRDAQNLDAWHNYHPALMFMMLDTLPQSIFFKAAVQGREQLVKSFAKSYANGSYKFLLDAVFNNVANTIPSVFWVIYHIFSNPVVLEECRNEESQAVQGDQDETITINLSFVLSSCPILLSTYHEVFRYHGMVNSVRVVSEDHILNDKYLLKKGSLVMMSARAQHSNPAVWGENVDEFYHKRFIKQKSTGKSLSPVAFRGFGGGTTLCPGRHFATSEILLLTTFLLLRFNVRPTNMQWVLPQLPSPHKPRLWSSPAMILRYNSCPRVRHAAKHGISPFRGVERRSF